MARCQPGGHESNVLEAIEPEIRFLEKVNRVDSVAAEGRAEIIIDFDNGVNISKALTDVQSAVSRINTFPQDMERPVVSQIVNSDLVCRLSRCRGPIRRLRSSAMRAV